jgi:hypothetical protein
MPASLGQSSHEQGSMRVTHSRSSVRIDKDTTQHSLLCGLSKSGTPGTSSAFPRKPRESPPQSRDAVAGCNSDAMKLRSVQAALCCLPVGELSAKRREDGHRRCPRPRGKPGQALRPVAPAACRPPVGDAPEPATCNASINRGGEYRATCRVSSSSSWSSSVCGHPNRGGGRERGGRRSSAGRNRLRRPLFALLLCALASRGDFGDNA